MKHFLSLCLFLLSSLVALTAQTENTNENQLLIHLDQPFYVTGEIIQYALHFPPAFAGRSVAVRMALVDRSGKSITDHHLRSEGNTCLTGLLKIPYELASDVYGLLAVGTRREDKKKLKLAEAFIPIYNDLEPAEPAGAQSPDWPATELPGNALTISVTLADPPQRRGGQVEAILSITDRNGAPLAAGFSVAVTDQRLFGDSSSDLQWGSGSPAVSDLRPELLEEQPYISGRLLSSAGEPLPNRAFATYIPERGESLTGETDEQGRFALALPDLTGPATLQFIDLRGAPLQIVLNDEPALAKWPPLPGNETVNEYIKWSRSRKVIYQLYNTLEATIEQAPPNRQMQTREPDQRVILDQYPDFRDLATFLTEVSTPLKMRTDPEGNYYAQMFNPNPRMRAFYQGSPIFIVDGKITRDAGFIQQLELSKIDTLDLYFDFFNLNRTFGKLGNSGVVVIKTSLPDLELPPADEAARRHWYGRLPVSTVVYPTEAGPGPPAFRPQVHWAADQRTGPDGKARLSFVQSDDPGSFTITVAVRSADGRVGYHRRQYEVQW